MKTNYHAVLTDETGCEFGADFAANSREEAMDHFRECYPESRVVQLESPQDAADRERAMYARICAEYDDGRYYDEDY